MKIYDSKNIKNIVLIGAPKSGTTSLHYYLNEHPEILMSSVKEPNFFSDKEIVDQGLYYETSRINTSQCRTLNQRTQAGPGYFSLTGEYIFLGTPASIPHKCDSLQLCPLLPAEFLSSDF